MKKLLTIALALVLVCALATASAATKLVIGASSTPHAEILEAAKELLAAKDIELEIVVAIGIGLRLRDLYIYRRFRGFCGGFVRQMQMVRIFIQRRFLHIRKAQPQNQAQQKCGANHQRQQNF